VNPAKREKQSLLNRAVRHLQRSELDQAELVMERLWPQPAGTLHPRRLELLLRVRPDVAAEQLAAAPAEAVRGPEVSVVVARMVLALPGEVLQSLRGLPLAALDDIIAVRQAAHLVGQGQDDQAQAMLRTVGLRSPCRNARLFLRGLMAWSNHRDDEALRAFRGVDGRDGCGPVAQAFAQALDSSSTDNESQGSHDRVVRRFLKGVGLRPDGSQGLLTEVAELVAQRKPNALLRTVARSAESAPPLVRKALSYDLPGALLAMGVEPADVLHRVDRALSIGTGSTEALRLLCLLLETSQQPTRAAFSWYQMLNICDPDDRPADRYDRPRRLKAAAIRRHLGEAMAFLAEGCDGQDGHPLLFDDDYDAIPEAFLRRYTCPYLPVAYAHLQRATELDPEDLRNWQAAVDLAIKLPDNKEQGRAVERLVQQFPEEPTALAQAARLAGKRNAFDKGLRFARRAAELEPMNRALRDLEVKLLLGKARTKHSQGATTLAYKLYGAARSVPLTTRAARLKASAEGAAFCFVQGDADTATAWRAEVLEGDNRPWLWSAFLSMAHAYMVPDSRRPRGKKRAKANDGAALPELLPLLDQSPQADEAGEIMRLYGSYDSYDPAPNQLDALVRAVAFHHSQLLSSAPELLTALEFIPERDALALTLAERGQRLFPEEIEFVLCRYETALMQGVPGSYFANAAQELRDVQHKLAEGPGRALEQLDDDFSAAFRVMAKHRRLEERAYQLQNNVASYLRRESRKTPKSKAKPKSKARKEAGQAGQSAEQHSLPFGD
jgi:hypothetical protein